jgi:hypothetical protein
MDRGRLGSLLIFRSGNSSDFLPRHTMQQLRFHPSHTPRRSLFGCRLSGRHGPHRVRWQRTAPEVLEDQEDRADQQAREDLEAQGPPLAPEQVHHMLPGREDTPGLAAEHASNLACRSLGFHTGAIQAGDLDCQIDDLAALLYATPRQGQSRH